MIKKLNKKYKIGKINLPLYVYLIVIFIILGIGIGFGVKVYKYNKKEKFSKIKKKEKVYYIYYYENVNKDKNYNMFYENFKNKILNINKGYDLSKLLKNEDIEKIDEEKFDKLYDKLLDDPQILKQRKQMNDKIFINEEMISFGLDKNTIESLYMEYKGDIDFNNLKKIIEDSKEDLIIKPTHLSQGFFAYYKKDNNYGLVCTDPYCLDLFKSKHKNIDYKTKNITIDDVIDGIKKSLTIYNYFDGKDMVDMKRGVVVQTFINGYEMDCFIVGGNFVYLQYFNKVIIDFNKKVYAKKKNLKEDIIIEDIKKNFENIKKFSENLAKKFELPYCRVDILLQKKSSNILNIGIKKIVLLEFTPPPSIGTNIIANDLKKFMLKLRKKEKEQKKRAKNYYYF